MSQSDDANRWAGASDWYDRALRLDKFAVEDPESRRIIILRPDVISHATALVKLRNIRSD